MGGKCNLVSENYHTTMERDLHAGSAHHEKIVRICAFTLTTGSGDKAGAGGASASNKEKEGENMMGKRSLRHMLMPFLFAAAAGERSGLLLPRAIMRPLSMRLVWGPAFDANIPP